MPGEKTIVRTTCPRDCYDACGIAVIKRGGKVTKVLGDPDHKVSRGALCGKCAIAYNGVIRDPGARLTRPLKRVGPKGEGRFQPIGWDEAIGIVADRLKAIAAEDGPQAIYHCHYTGTCSLIAGGFPMRFLNRLGASDIEPDTICNLAGHVALGYQYGSSVVGFDPRAARDAACILVWGANPAHSAPHAHKHWLKEAPGRKIVVDPFRHGTAAEADIHLQPFPGTDAALAFAMLHAIRAEGLLDRDYLARHTIGWDQLEPLLDPCTPAWGEARTGVPAALIAEAARLYGKGPSLLWLGQGLQRQPLGGNIFRAVGLLPPATGNIGKPGAGFLYLNGAGRKGIDGDYLEAPHLRPTPRTSLSHMDLVETLEAGRSIKALLCWNINIAASNPQQERLHRALRSEDLFTVSIDLFQTDTGDHADIVLPAASFLEFDDMVSSYFNLTLSAQAKAMEPIGEALPNQEIFRRLASAMGFNEPELYEPDAAILDRLAKSCGVTGGFEALAGAGTIELWPDPVPQFADGRFPTPSGKIEIASAAAARDGYPLVPQPQIDPRPRSGRFRLLSPASAWLMNSSYGNDPLIAQKNGEEGVTLHPEDATALGLEAGATVRLRNETGELAMRLAVAPVVPRGVALASKSRWIKGARGHANVNCLNPGRKTDMGESTAVHGVEVEILPQEAAADRPTASAAE
ncbi:MAG: molybdopterin-dependent oxidoreductase [Dongiaceae bacterium]